MRVFFITSHENSSELQPYVNEVLRVLRKHQAIIMTPEDKVVDSDEYRQSVGPRTQYAHIMQGIAEADAVIIEASGEDFLAGHQVTLALFYGRPTLVLSQSKSYSDAISHELLFSSQYHTKRDLKNVLNDFLSKIEIHLSPLQESMQKIGQAADVMHAAALSPLRHNALRDPTEFGEWARLAEKDPEKASKKVLQALGKLPVEPAWSAFAQIYNEDTPDYIFQGSANFTQHILAKAGVSRQGVVVNVDAKTGSFARNLASLGFTNIIAAESSRQMLAEAFRLCTHIPQIKIIEENIPTFQLSEKADAVTWMDYGSNFALTAQTLRDMLEQLLKNIRLGGRLLFDIRTNVGWEVAFFRQRISTVSTPRFQRVSIRDIDQSKHTIRLDRFIRTRSVQHEWEEWRREQMTERMWTLRDVVAVLNELAEGELVAIYDDNFAKIRSEDEPGLAYIEIKKI